MLLLSSLCSPNATNCLSWLNLYNKASSSLSLHLLNSLPFNPEIYMVIPWTACPLRTRAARFSRKGASLMCISLEISMVYPCAWI